MDLNNYKEWDETLSKNDFQFLFKQLFEYKEKYEDELLIEMLCALSDRYTKFYDDLLQPDQKSLINALLIELTDLTNLNRMLDLVNIMFNFKIDMYCEYLDKNYDKIISESVKKEVLEALKEYKTL
jgi:hypothetical protein